MLSDIYFKLKTLNGEEGRNGLIKFRKYESREKSIKPKIFLKKS